MNNFRESMLAAAGRNTPCGPQHQFRRGNNRDSDENFNFFSKNRRNDDSSEVSGKLGRLSLGSAKLPKSGIDDLLSSNDGGKNDYDWLLTPPGTPLFPSSERIESQPAVVAPRTSSSVRSSSITKASRLSVSQSESNHSIRPARSSSVTRSSISTSHYTSYSSNRSSSILNTSSTSVSSYIRPSSPVTRSPATARPSTPSRSTISRSSTPSRVRPAPITTSNDKTRPSQNSRPSTPCSRPQTSSGINSTTSARLNSRPSTPTRRSPASSPSSATSASRVPSRAPSLSRPSSPSPRVRAPQQPIVPPDFPHDTPPNLRTTLPDRPVSAGRSRPGAALTVKPEPISSVTAPRRHSSPIVSRGRTTESAGISRVHSNGHEPRSHATEMSMRRPVKPSPTVKESNGFGRNISKKSLDVAIRHMDLKNGNGNARPLSSTTLFPQSVRSAPSKTRSSRSTSGSDFIKMSGDLHSADIMRNGNNPHIYAESGSEASDGRYSAKLSDVDIYESSRYDAMLLKEDLKNTNWLHSVDDKSDQGSIFDNGFELLPEPFGLL